MSIRTDLRDTLAADWATIPDLTGVRVVASERDIDAPQEAPTALIRVRSITATPEAPTSHRNVGLLLTIISRHTDLDQAADELDGLVFAALDYLDTRYQHEPATAVGWGARRLAYDIPLTVIASKE